MAQVGDSDLRVIPGRRLGPVTSASTVQTLRAALGARNVRIDSLDVGEGVTEPGVILFPADRQRRAYVYWRDTLAFRQPLAVAIRDTGTKWMVPGPITIGTPLAEVERLNGRPFTFSGFDWDYGGRTIDWNGGKLSVLLGPGFQLRLTLGQRCHPRLSDSAWAEVAGDREVSSSNAAARTVCPVVEELWLGIAP
jgi:hypothetical protein